MCCVLTYPALIFSGSGIRLLVGVLYLLVTLRFEFRIAGTANKFDKPRRFSFYLVRPVLRSVPW